MPKSRMGVFPWITFSAIASYFMPEGFHACLHSRHSGLRWSCVGKELIPFFWLHVGHCLSIVARFLRQASCPLVLCYVVLSVSNASSMASRARIWGFRISGPASLFLLPTSAFASACLRIVPVPYMAPVTTDFGIEIRSPLHDSTRKSPLVACFHR